MRLGRPLFGPGAVTVTCPPWREDPRFALEHDGDEDEEFLMSLPEAYEGDEAA